MTAAQIVRLGLAMLFQELHALAKRARAPKPPVSTPWPYKTTEHVREQIKAGARKH